MDIAGILDRVLLRGWLRHDGELVKNLGRHRRETRQKPDRQARPGLVALWEVETTNGIVARRATATGVV
jgi:hypothetical protein